MESKNPKQIDGYLFWIFLVPFMAELFFITIKGGKLMKVAYNQFGELVYAMKGTHLHPSAIYFCPHCHQVVRCCFKKNGHCYFKHLSSAHHTGETIAHQVGKRELYQSLKQQQLAASLESYEDRIDQRPDICVEWQQSWAIEYQCSVLSLRDMQARTKGLESLSKRVIWILGSSFLQKNLCQMVYYCIRHHQRLGNFLLFYGDGKMIIHHHLQLQEERRQYLCQQAQLSLSRINWRRLLRVYQEATVLKASSSCNYQKRWSSQELHHLQRSTRKEIRNFFEQLYCAQIRCEELPENCLQKPKYSWGYQTLKLIWQGYLWLRICSLSEGTEFSTNDCLNYLKTLEQHQLIRSTSCYQIRQLQQQEVQCVLQEWQQAGYLQSRSATSWQKRMNADRKTL